MWPTSPWRNSVFLSGGAYIRDSDDFKALRIGVGSHRRFDEVVPNLIEVTVFVGHDQAAAQIHNRRVRGSEGPDFLIGAKRDNFVTADR